MFRANLILTEFTARSVEERKRESYLRRGRTTLLTQKERREGEREGGEGGGERIVGCTLRKLDGDSCKTNSDCR